MVEIKYLVEKCYDFECHTGEGREFSNFRDALKYYNELVSTTNKPTKIRFRMEIKETLLTVIVGENI